MKTRTAIEWARVLVACEVKPITAAKWAQSFSEQLVGNALSLGDAELDDFLGQILHESQRLEKVEESLYYSTPGRMMAVWPTRFATLNDEQPYRCSPEALANKVYGGRLGNVSPGDGWRYRGRGLIMVTGRNNYEMVGEAIGIDLIEDPDQLKTPPIALRATIRWWEKTLPDALMGNLIAVTKRVNGGTVGLPDRQHLTTLAAQALGL